jgi:hypothetical protein
MKAFDDRRGIHEIPATQGTYDLGMKVSDLQHRYGTQFWFHDVRRKVGNGCGGGHQ